MNFKYLSSLRQHTYNFVSTYTLTHTHLLRTIFANSEVECILRAKNTPSIPDRNGSVKRPEKVSKSTIAVTSARCKELEADTSVQLSQIVPTMTNCDHSAVMKRHEMKRLAGSGLSRWP